MILDSAVEPTPSTPKYATLDPFVYNHNLHFETPIQHTHGVLWLVQSIATVGMTCLEADQSVHLSSCFWPGIAACDFLEEEAAFVAGSGG
jgi:hypothetical protein